MTFLIHIMANIKYKPSQVYFLEALPIKSNNKMKSVVD